MVFLFLAVVACCVTAYLLVPRFLPLTFHLTVTQTTAPGVPADIPTLDVMPPELVRLIAAESEPFAREALLQRAQRLFVKYGNWTEVTTALAVTLNEVD